MSILTAAAAAAAAAAAGAVTQTYTYNSRRLLASERLTGFSSIDWLTQYTYNANGHLSTLTYPDLHAVSYAPNALGQPTQAVAGGTTYATGVAYFPNGAVKQFSYGNGLLHVMVQNARGLPETSVDESGTVSVIDDTYLYDANGNVTQILDGTSGAPGTRTMAYDRLDRLTAVTAGSAQGGNAMFEYDPVDNIRRLDQGARAIRHVYAAGNRLTSVTDAAGATLYTMTYDIRGNQTLRTRGALEDQFTFDKANRLTDTAIGASSATHTGGTLSSYLYDGLGRRVRETTGQITVSGYSQAGQLLYQDDRKPAIDEKHNYIYLAGSLVAKRTVPVSGSTVITYQHTDALGSPIATTNASGALIAYERLTAYGEPADTTMQRGPGFTGHVMDPTTSLVYMQQRYYDPAVGRFVSSDPVSSDTTKGWNFNRYNYAANNPFRFTDPDGRKFQGALCENPVRCRGTIDVNPVGPIDDGESESASAPATPPGAASGPATVTFNKPPPTTVPPSGDNAEALQCVADRCSGGNLLVTGGAETSGHVSGSRHFTDEAVDIAGPPHNDIDHVDMMKCARTCGYSHGWWEVKGSSRKDHWHLQFGAGNGVPEIPGTPTIVIPNVVEGSRSYYDGAKDSEQLQRLRSR